MTYATGGSHSITAVYNGDTNYSTSTSPILTQSVGTTATSTVVASNHNPSTVGQQVTYTATVSPTASTTAGPAPR